MHAVHIVLIMLAMVHACHTSTMCMPSMRGMVHSMPRMIHFRMVVVHLASSSFTLFYVIGLHLTGFLSFPGL
jgi:hypothetical protein